MSRYQWERGQHWKVHVNQIASGTQDFEQNFAKIIEQQIKPFLAAARRCSRSLTATTISRSIIWRWQGGRQPGRAEPDRGHFDFTARGFLIPAVLVNGTVQGTADANSRFLTQCIDPICDQLQEEITRKRYGFDGWKQGNFVRVDSSAILHFDMFANAANVESWWAAAPSRSTMCCGRPTRPPSTSRGPMNTFDPEHCADPRSRAADECTERRQRE